MPLRDHLKVIALASLGGLLGIVGAFFGELRSFADPWVLGPIIEEIMKPFGVYLLLLRWSHLVQNRTHRALLAALGGFLFAIVEAVVYVTVYVDDPSLAFVAYRFSVPLVLHTASSFVMGLGVDAKLMGAVLGQAPFPTENLKYLATAMGLHSAFNRVATIIDAFVA